MLFKLTKEYIAGLSKSRLIEIILELQEKHNRLAIQLEGDTSAEEEKEPRKNSENSSLPSSKDIAKGKVQTKAPQKKGPKFGHAGKSRERVAEPDIIIFNKLKKCPRTQQPIDSTSSSYHAHQVIELIPGAMQVIEIRRQTTTGPDGKTVTAPNIDGINDYQHYGPYLKSVVGSMRYEYHMEWDNIKKMLMAMYGFKKIAQGALNNIFAELKEELENDYADIGKSVKEAKIKGADETGARINGEPGWLWVFRTEDAAYYKAATTRGHDVPVEVLGANVIGTLVTDFFGAYSEKFLKAGDFQKCLAHLARDLKFAIEINNNPDGLSCRLLDILREAMNLKDNEAFNSSSFLIRKMKIYKNFELLISDEKICCNRLEKRLLRRVRKYRKHLFTFLEKKGVPFDNNGSERDIRMVVMFRNIYNGFRNLESAERLAVIFSVIQTCRKQGRDSFRRIQDAFGCGKFVAAANNANTS